MLRSYSYSTGLEVAKQYLSLIEVARQSLLDGQVNDAIGFVQIICEDRDQFLLNLETTFVHLEDGAEEMHKELLGRFTAKAELAADAQRYQKSITEHQNDIQDAKWVKEYLAYQQNDAKQKLCEAEHAHQEAKNERETIRFWDLFVGWFSWADKNRSCDAKMATEKQAMDEARKQAADAEMSRDVVDALLKEDEKKVLSAKEKLRECEKKMAEYHQLIGDLKKLHSSVVILSRNAEKVIDFAGQACSNVDMLAKILDECLTRPAVGQSRGTKLQFEQTQKSLSEVRAEIITANGHFLFK